MFLLVLLLLLLESYLFYFYDFIEVDTNFIILGTLQKEIYNYFHKLVDFIINHTFCVSLCGVYNSQHC